MRNLLTLKAALLIGGLCFLIACGGLATDATSGAIASIQTPSEIADGELLIEIAKKFYESHPDQYDMLVLWGSKEFAPGHSFYWPVKNDVHGIGEDNNGAELFDNSADYGSSELQGIIWMGPDWLTNTESGSGPRSILGILAQETGHRWAATLHFADPTLNATSNALLEDAYHWNFYLDTGTSPMGGNKWESLGGSLYKAEPVDSVEYSQLDLYTMGLLPAEEVAPVKLLVNTHSQSASLNMVTSKVYSRTTAPITVQADIKEITIDQIIAAEGKREPDAGFNAKNIRQAWIYVYKVHDGSYYSKMNELEELRKEWYNFFSNATGGLGAVSTELQY